MSTWAMQPAQFEPPVCRGMKELDRKQFVRDLKVVALRMVASETGQFLRDYGKPYILRAGRIATIVRDPTSPTHRLVILNSLDRDSIPSQLHEIIAEKQFEIVDSSVRFGYEYWSADQILQATLPLKLLDESPTGFTQVGHIGHVNLRDEYLPHKNLIGQVILDKNISLRTVVNKLKTIDNEFRNFKMEVLAGDDDFIVTASEANCQFVFDFSLVYWNSRLSTEHGLLVDAFSEHDVVVDAFAGVGPFAIPAGKKGCGVLASDLNPASASALKENARINRVQDTVRTANEDARAFIRQSVLDLWKTPFPAYKPRISVNMQQRTIRRERQALLNAQSAPTSDSTPSISLDALSLASSSSPSTPLPPTTTPGPDRRLVDHFVMNLPATAIEFLDAFRGLYVPLRKLEGAQEAIEARGEDGLPMVHCYCFTKEGEGAEEDILERASLALGMPITTATKGYNLRFVRDVAPKKEMYCLEFRLSMAMLE